METNRESSELEARCAYCGKAPQKCDCDHTTTQKPTRNAEAGDLGLHDVMRLFAETDNLAAIALRLYNDRLELLEACEVAALELAAWDAQISSLGLTPLGHAPRTRKALTAVCAAIAIAKREAL